MKLKDVLKITLVATIYYVLTVLLFPISYGGVQFRIAEVLMLLCFYNPKYIIALGMGCFLANLYSPLGIIDAIVGTSATILAGLAMYYIRYNLYLAAIWPVLFNGIIIGLQLTIIFNLTPFIPSLFLMMGSVALGETAVMIIGVIIFKIMGRNEKFLEMIGNTKKNESL